MEVFDIQLDRGGVMYKQIYEWVVGAIKSGVISDGEQLPSIRTQAEYLGVSRNTVDIAYQNLVSDGYATVKNRSGYFVLSDGGKDFGVEEETDPGCKYNLSLNGVDLSGVNYGAFSKIVRNIIDLDGDLFGNGQKQGEYELRKQIAKYLYISRGIECDPHLIVIGAGKDYLLSMLTQILNGTYGMEIPGSEKIYRALSLTGSDVKLIESSFEGITPDVIGGVDIMYMNPIHHLPLGYTLSTPECKEFLNWASEKDGRYIIEDDYDGEFQYDYHFGAMKRLDKNDKVIFIGDFFRSIAPGEKTAYMVLPKSLITEWKTKLKFYSPLISKWEQRTVSEYIRQGYLIKGIRKSRDIYKAKRDAAIGALKKSKLWEKLEIYGQGAGTHFIIQYREREEDELLRSSRAIGVKMVPVSSFRLMRKWEKDKRKGAFTFGFGGLRPAEIEGAVSLLEKAWL